MPPMSAMPAEAVEYADPVSGVRVRQLTDHLCHSNHLYFTNNGWFDHGRRLLFESDRGNRRNLYALDLDTFAIKQITDLENGYFHTGFVNPTRDELYTWCAGRLLGIDLHTGQTRCLYELDPGWLKGSLSVTADGESLLFALTQKPTRHGHEDLENLYVGAHERFTSGMPNRIHRLSIAGGDPEVLREERCWIGHVNTSPTRPDLLTFCHEGPWLKVDHRIWGMDLNTGATWKIRPANPGEAIGHEYWLEDGETIGYHGHVDGRALFGFVRYDNQHPVEAPFPTGSHHFHSNTTDLVVGDGDGHVTPYIMLWRFDGEAFSEPRVLCAHRGSRHTQRLHVHPRFSPDGRSVLFTSDRTGYGQVYLAEVPDFESLPALSAVST